MSKLPIKILIYQTNFYKYRDFLWENIEKEFNQKVEKFTSYTLLKKRVINIDKKNNSLIVIVNGSPLLFKLHLFLALYSEIKVIAITQLTRKNVFKKYIQYLYLYILFSKTLFYYKSEINIFAKKFLNKKFDYFNNTTVNLSTKNIEIIKIKIKSNLINEILVLGRDTLKSNHKLLMDCLIHVKSHIKINIVGSNKDNYLQEIMKLKNNVELNFYSQTYDYNFLSKLATKSNFALYPGNIGLSIVDYAKLGCIPIVHNVTKLHFPEYYDYKYVHKFPVINFENNKYSLARILDQVQNNRFKKMSLETYEKIIETYDHTFMCGSFCDSINSLIKN